jgi:hypothetical protein
LGKKRGEYRVLVGKSEELERPRRRWVVNIKIDSTEVEKKSMDRSGSGQGQVESCFECCDEPSGFIKYEKFLEWLRTC